MTSYLPKEKLIELLYDMIAAEGSQSRVAELLGITPPHLSDILHGKREISEKVAKRLKFYRRTVFEPIE